MTDKVIAEVDEKLEGKIEKKTKGNSISLLLGQLSATKRQVNKLLGRMNHNTQISNFTNNQQHKSTINIVDKKVKQQRIGKYNYYGKKYRFQQRQQALQVEPVKIQRQCVSQINVQTRKQKHNYSPKTQLDGVKSNIAHIDQSLFFDDGQIKIPSQNYYIYFQKPERKTVDSFKRQKARKEQKLDEALPQKFKPAWLMQKKINSLQKQLKQIKDRQKRRYLNQSQPTKTMINTYDQPINLKSNVERMVQSLWR